MILRLVLRHVRIHELCVVDFTPQLSVLYGNNGIGKTTILESIFLLTALKSFRTSSLPEVLSHSYEAGSIEAKFKNPDHTRKIDILPRSKILYRDGHKESAVEEFLKGENAVCLAPEHGALIKGGPEERRRYLDTILFAKDPTFLNRARRYQRALKQKTALLKQELPKSVYIDQVLPWEQELILHGDVIRSQRKALIDELKPFFKDQYQTLSDKHGRLQVIDMIYRAKDQSIQEEILQKRDAEYFARRVLTGCHRDDVSLELDGSPAKETASQGEAATLLLSLKTSEYLFLESTTGLPPILILDDVGGTLDQLRRKSLFEWIQHKENQVLMSTADPHIFEIAQGLGGVHVTL